MEDTNNEIKGRQERHHFIISMQRLFSGREYRYLAISLITNLLLAEALVFSLSTSFSSFAAMMTAGYVWTSTMLSLFLAILFGLAVSQVLYLAGQRSYWQGVGRSVAGAGLAAISMGCPICGAPLLDLLGLSGGLAAFPLQGLEIKVLAAGLLFSAVWANSLAIAQQYKDRLTIGEENIAEFSNTAVRRKPRLIPAVMILVTLAVLFLLPKLPSQAKLNFLSPNAPAGAARDAIVARLIDQVAPPEGFTIPATYGDLGPRLIEVGAIDHDQFVGVYQQAGQPLDETQLGILTKGSDQLIVIDQENAHFLLNLFWAVGLTNQNSILDEGYMMMYGVEGVGHFASTGGWTIGSHPADELFSSQTLVALTEEQQARLVAVAERVYRPCCNNHTAFPDCNHGMAMLGLLELMASQDASEAEMFEATKYVSAFWFPQQALEVALYVKASQGIDFSELEGKSAVGAELFSASGFQQVHNWLTENGLLEQTPSSGSSCGV